RTMNPDALFQLSSSLVLPAWLLLAVGLLLQGSEHVRSQRSARWALWLGGRALPVLLGLLYAGLILKGWGQAPGGFESLDALSQLFSARDMLLAGWVHYLAFDLWVGRWQIDELARRKNAGQPVIWALRLAVLPCLGLTLYFGPIGLLLFLALMGLHSALGKPQPTHT
ncbi:MAG: abscisic acid-deficient protein Aba4 family protein, partial [Burkholderiales bacterium]